MNKMSSKDELLVIMAEEAGEVVQECMKLVRFPDNNKLKLTDELGDMLCMIHLAVDHGLISWSDIVCRSKVKQDKLKKWSKLYG